jgi:hypothetical protein
VRTGSHSVDSDDSVPPNTSDNLSLGNHDPAGTGNLVPESCTDPTLARLIAMIDALPENLRAALRAALNGRKTDCP